MIVMINQIYMVYHDAAAMISLSLISLSVWFVADDHSAAGFIKSAAAQERPRDLLFENPTVAAYTTEILVILSSTEDKDTHFECLKITVKTTHTKQYTMTP